MKKEEKTELTKKKILSAAMQEFGTNGYRGASLNAICDTGIPKGLLYHNFKNKDALYLSCVKQSFEALTKCFREADIRSDLKEYMRVRMEFFEKNKMEASIFFDAVLQPPEALLPEISELKQEFDELNKDIYKKILDSIQLREGITYDEAMRYFTMLQDMFNHSFSIQNCQNVSLSDRIAVHERDLPVILDFMLYGIARK